MSIKRLIDRRNTGEKKRSRKRKVGMERKMGEMGLKRARKRMEMLICI